MRRGAGEQVIGLFTALHSHRRDLTPQERGARLHGWCSHRTRPHRAKAPPCVAPSSLARKSSSWHHDGLRPLVQDPPRRRRGRRLVGAAPALRRAPPRQAPRADARRRLPAAHDRPQRRADQAARLRHVGPGPLAEHRSRLLPVGGGRAALLRPQLRRVAAERRSLGGGDPPVRTARRPGRARRPCRRTLP